MCYSMWVMARALPICRVPTHSSTKNSLLFPYQNLLKTNQAPRMAVRGIRSEFAYYVPRILNRTVLAYRTSVQFLKRTVPTYPTGIITKKAYHTSWQKLRRTALPFLLLTTRNFNWLWNHWSINQRSQFTHLASAAAVFCLCLQKFGAMCENSGIFNSNSVPTYRTRTITKKAYRTS